MILLSLLSVDQTAATVKPSLLLTTPKPQLIQTTIPPGAHLYPPVTVPAPEKTSSVTVSSNATSTKPSLAASVVLSNRTTNVMLSIGSVTPSNVTTTESPRVIANKPSSILPVTPFLNPLNVTLGAADQLKGVNEYVSLSETPVGDLLVKRKWCSQSNVQLTCTRNGMEKFEDPI